LLCFDCYHEGHEHIKIKTQVSQEVEKLANDLEKLKIQQESLAMKTQGYILELQSLHMGSLQEYETKTKEVLKLIDDNSNRK